MKIMKKYIPLAITAIILCGCVSQARQQYIEGMRLAKQQSVDAMNMCNAKRLKGELKTHIESVNCSNPVIIAAYTKAHYPYMDLQYLLTSKRLEVAEREDKKELTEIQAKLEIQEYALKLRTIETQRDRQIQADHDAQVAAFANALNNASASMQAQQQRNMDSITEQMNANRVLNCNSTGMGRMSCY